MRLSALQTWVYRNRRGESVQQLPVQVTASVAAEASMLEVVAVGGSRGRFAVGTDVTYVALLVTALVTNRPANDVPGCLKTGHGRA
ncbi:hypothetical protein D7Y11_30790 [Corallococcus sp. AB018]|nr:hypothetical protein D7Y11_30790 [Corallococcus sp. AB018]